MTLNPPHMVRAALYVLTLVGTPLVAYLNARGVIGALEVTLWSAEVAAVTGMAALNTSNPEPRRRDEYGATDLTTLVAVLAIVVLVVLAFQLL